MRRGEVWWANLPGRAGRRPVLLLSRDISCEVRQAVTVAEVTSTIRNIPVEVRLDESDGMPRESVVNLDNIITIRKSRLTGLLTSLPPGKMAQVREAVIYALDLKEPI